jgi:hypothetical protein
MFFAGNKVVRKVQCAPCRKQGCAESPMNTHIADTPRIRKMQQRRISERGSIFFLGKSIEVKYRN